MIFKKSSSCIHPDLFSVSKLARGDIPEEIRVEVFPGEHKMWRVAFPSAFTAHVTSVQHSPDFCWPLLDSGPW